MKKRLVLSGELIFELKRIEQATLSPPWPDFQKIPGENLSILPKNAILYLIKNIFKIKPALVLIAQVTFFHVK